MPSSARAPGTVTAAGIPLCSPGTTAQGTRGGCASAEGCIALKALVSLSTQRLTMRQPKSFSHFRSQCTLISATERGGPEPSYGAVTAAGAPLCPPETTAWGRRGGCASAAGTGTLGGSGATSITTDWRSFRAICRDVKPEAGCAFGSAPVSSNSLTSAARPAAPGLLSNHTRTTRRPHSQGQNGKYITHVAYSWARDSCPEDEGSGDADGARESVCASVVSCCDASPVHVGTARMASIEGSSVLDQTDPTADPIHGRNIAFSPGLATKNRIAALASDVCNRQIISRFCRAAGRS